MKVGAIMKKIAVIFLTAIFIFGNFEICNANSASNLLKILRAVPTTKFIKTAKNASDGYDILKMGAALIKSDTLELELLGVQNSDYEDWYYLDNIFLLTVQNGIVKVVACERENFATKRGIKIGSTLESVVNAYGTNYDTVAVNDYCDAYIYSVKIEGNIVDRVSNFLTSKKSKIGRMIFIISRQNPQVLGLATALSGVTCV